MGLDATTSQKPLVSKCGGIRGLSVDVFFYEVFAEEAKALTVHRATDNVLP